MSQNTVRRIIVSTARAPGAIGPYNQVSSFKVRITKLVLGSIKDFFWGFYLECNFFCTRFSPGLLPVLGPLGSGTDTTHQPSPALRLLGCWWSRVKRQVVRLMLLLCESERLIHRIRTHQSRVTTVISPHLYLQATTAGFRVYLLLVH